MASRFFGSEGPNRPHLVAGSGGVAGEVGDLRNDAESAFQRVQDEHDATGVSLTPKAKFTEEGGLAALLINDTGATSVKGTVVDTSGTVDDAVSIVPADGFDAVGVIYESGVADGDPVWVVISGVAEVLLEDGTDATRGYWVRTSVTQPGRADATSAFPPGATIPAIEDHLKEVGHCVESKASGTDVLAKCLLHFN